MMTLPTATLAIGGFGFHEHRLAGPQPGLPPQYRPFAADCEPAVTCQVHSTPRPRASEYDWRLVFDASPNWSLYRYGRQLLFRTMFLEALCDQELRHCDLFPLPGSEAVEAPISFFSYPLAELISITLLARENGVLLHSCGVEVAGQALLFCGQSGIGKSTMAGIWQGHGYRILSDDRVIVRQIDGRLMACGTPWHGSAELGCPAILPLAGIYLLGRGPANRLTPVSGAHALSLAIPNGFLPFWDKEAMEHCLSFLELCLAAVPCATLEFLPDEGVIPFLLAASALSDQGRRSSPDALP